MHIIVKTHANISTKIVCGTSKSKQRLVLSLPSEAAVALFHSVNCCPPPDDGTLILPRGCWIFFFSEEELARSCCTKATGQTVLLGIKCMYTVLPQ